MLRPSRSKTEDYARWAELKRAEERMAFLLHYQKKSNRTWLLITASASSTFVAGVAWVLDPSTSPNVPVALMAVMLGVLAYDIHNFRDMSYYLTERD